MTTAVASPPGLSSFEVASRIPLPWFARQSGTVFVEALLEQERLRGHVRRVPDGWRLTEEFEATHGESLRNLA